MTTVPRKRGGTSRSRPPLARALLLALFATVAGGGAFLVLEARPQSAPVLHQYFPGQVEPGQTLRILGAAFEPTEGANNVYIGDTPVFVSAATETELTVRVPSSLEVEGQAELKLSVGARGQRSNTLFLTVYRAPRIDELRPLVALPGETVMAHGAHFREPFEVTVGGLPAQVQEATADGLRFIVPDVPLLIGEPTLVRSKALDHWGRPTELIVGRPPIVVSLAPVQGPPGTRVKITGYGFDSSPSANRVSLDGRRALVLAATGRELTVIAPSTRVSSLTRAPVSVRAFGNDSSTDVSFAIQKEGSAGRFVPSFFVSPVDDRADEVFVATELGPVLLLGSAGDDPSLVDRAARIAATLTRLARGGGGRVEAEREVVRMNEIEEILTVYDDDVDAYARSGRTPSPEELALHWAAILDDYFALFVRGERPYRVLDRSLRGRVLVDLFVESRRAEPSSGGVPHTTAEKAIGAWRTRFRAMAVEVPAADAGTGGTAIAGRWDGEVTQATPEPREIRLDLRMSGVSLSGRLTSEVNQVAVTVPIRSVRYSRRGLGFLAGLGGEDHFFDGELSGSEIAGDILEREGGEPVGRFKVVFVE